MSNNSDITINDFENVCRTCLSSEDLKPLNEKYTQSTCLAKMLMTCTFVKFAEDDGLPVKICTNCIHELNQAYLFAKRCETTDTILRKCVKIKTEVTDNSSQSEKLEPTIRTEDEIKIEIKSEIITQTVQNAVSEFQYMGDVKQEQNPNLEIISSSINQEVVEDYEFVAVNFSCEEDVKLEHECDETYDFPVSGTYEENNDEDLDETYSEISDHSGFMHRRKDSLNSHMKKCVFCSRGIFEKDIPQNNSHIVHINCLRCYVCKEFIRNSRKYERYCGAIYCGDECLGAVKRWPGILCGICKGIIKDKSKKIVIGKISYHIHCVKCNVCSAVPSTDVRLICFNSAFYCQMHKPKRKPVKFKRSKITQEQADIMKKYFKENRYLKSGRATQIGKEVGLKRGIVSVWFQNMRQRHEKK